MQVSFAYHITSLNAEFTIAVTANVYPGSPAIGFDHDSTQPYAEIVAATFHPTARQKAQIWENIPAVIRQDMERVAIEKVFSEEFEFV